MTHWPNCDTRAGPGDRETTTARLYEQGQSVRKLNSAHWWALPTAWHSVRGTPPIPRFTSPPLLELLELLSAGDSPGCSLPGPRPLGSAACRPHRRTARSLLQLAEERLQQSWRPVCCIHCLAGLAGRCGHDLLLMHFLQVLKSLCNGGRLQRSRLLFRC